AQLVELLADDVLHRDVRDAVVLVDVVDVDDVRVVEQRADARLVEEHLDDPRIVGELGAQPLDHDFLLEAGHRGLPRQVDPGHAAGRQPADERVAAAERGRLEVGGAMPHHRSSGGLPIGAPIAACAASVASIAARAGPATGSGATRGASTAGAANAASTSVIP